MPTFGEELTRLALSVSVINDENWKDIREDLNTYFVDKVGACYWEICIAGIRIDNAPGLKTVASMDNQEHVYTLSGQNENAFRDFRSYAYEKGMPLWMTEKTQKALLSKGAILVDEWSSQHAKDKGFPKKMPKGYDRLAKTVLYNVLNFQGNNFGVFVLEHEDKKILTDEMRSDIILTNEALSRIVRVWQTTKEQTDALSVARKRFTKFVGNCSSITEPTLVFLASPSNRDEEVWIAINDVLKSKDFKRRFEPKIWDEDNTPGNIVSQILDYAQETTLAICLLSEKLTRRSSSSKKKMSRDNSNVVFEAGLFEGLVKSPEYPCAALICIRESEEIAGQLFFDISQQRICMIERDEKLKFDAKSFKENFAEMLKSGLERSTG